LSGPPAQGGFALIDHHGRRVTDADYRGRFQLVYFGFTHCKVVCPRALTRLSAILEGLPELATPIQPLYITVDPERDTPAVMKAFLEKRFPLFLGLTGSEEEIAEAQRVFRVFSKRSADPDDPEGYVMPHTAFTYLIGPDGRFIAHFPDTLDDATFAKRLATLVGA
jgi:protein SCO1/2